MQLISRFNKGFRFLLCVIDIYSKCACVIPLKDRKGTTIINAFYKALNEKKNAHQIKYILQYINKIIFGECIQCTMKENLFL